MNVYPLSLRFLRGWAPPHRYQALLIALGVILDLFFGPVLLPAGPGFTDSVAGTFPAADRANSAKIFATTEPQKVPKLAPEPQSAGTSSGGIRGCTPPRPVAGCACRLGGPNRQRILSSRSSVTEYGLTSLMSGPFANSGSANAPFVRQQEGER